MKIDDIKIYPCFAAHEPKPEKMQQKEKYLEETGALQSQIILDSRGNLIDGYTSYLLAKAHGIQCIPIRYGRRQIVRASHKPGGINVTVKFRPEPEKVPCVHGVFHIRDHFS